MQKPLSNTSTSFNSPQSQQNTGNIGSNNAISKPSCRLSNEQNVNAFNKNFWDVLEFPHIVAIGTNRNVRGQSQQIWKCVGSIINENFVVASSSCVRNEDSQRRPDQDVNVILVTDRNLNITYDEESMTKISKIAYNGDVALIKMQKNFE